MDLKALQEKYMAFLSEEGYRPILDDQGYIVFQFEGSNYALQFEENPNNKLIFTINLGFSYGFKSNEEKARALSLANFINRSLKVGKMWVNTDVGSVNVVIGLFIANEDDLKIFFLDCCIVMQSMFTLFDIYFYPKR
jgi:hypothetical protein